MKKIIILAIALLSTGIVFSAIHSKKETTAKTIEVKVKQGDFSQKNTPRIETDAIASAD